MYGSAQIMRHEQPNRSSHSNLLHLLEVRSQKSSFPSAEATRLNYILSRIDRASRTLNRSMAILALRNHLQLPVRLRSLDADQKKLSPKKRAQRLMEEDVYVVFELFTSNRSGDFPPVQRVRNTAMSQIASQIERFGSQRPRMGMPSYATLTSYGVYDYEFGITRRRAILTDPIEFASD